MLTYSVSYELPPDTFGSSRFIVSGEHANKRSTIIGHRASGIGIFLLFRCWPDNCPDPEDPDYREMVCFPEGGIVVCTSIYYFVQQ